MLTLPWETGVDKSPTESINAVDLELVRRAATDRASFGILYDRYVDRIYAYCFRRLQSREGAEDATSQTFLKLLVAVHRPQQKRGSVRSWIFTIAYHVMVDDFRTIRPMLSIDAEPEIATSADGPDEIALARETGREIQRMVAKLPHDQRDLIYLRLAGLTDLEIATVLGKSYGAVRVGQHRAVKRLRLLFEEETSSQEELT